MVERYANHLDIIGWQTDNEIGGGRTGRCYCDDCSAGFQKWLKAKYGSLDALNDAWGNIFWSQSYSAWDQIRTPSDHIDKKNPSHELDYFRFASDTFVDFQKEQINIIRELAPHHFVTHNFMGLYQDLDQYDLAADLDFATWDNYPTGNPERWRQLMYPPGMSTDSNDPVYAFDIGDPIITGMAHALTRALKDKPFWIMEQQCGQINWGKVNQWIRPGTTRLWSWHALMEGADTIVYFRWRPTIFAHEQYHSGVLKQDGTPDFGYYEHLKLAQEKELLDELTDQPFTADVAIVFDFNDLWALQLQPHRKDYHYLRHLYVYYHALNRMGIPVNLVSPNADLSPYKLVIAPTAHLAGEETAVYLTTYVQNGGTLLMGVRSGFKTPTNLVTTKPLPGELRELIGADVTSWRSLPKEYELPLQTEIPNLVGPATYWADTLKPDTATALAEFTTGEGAALTENVVGNGRCLYQGFYPTPEQAEALLTHLTGQLGIESIAKLPHGMLAYKRGPYTVVMNFTDETLEAVVGETAVSVPPRDVLVI